MNTQYPDHAYKTKRDWLKDVRARWKVLRKEIQYNEESVRYGCVYYPQEVFAWIQEFKKMDRLMQEYYKNT